MIFQTRPPLKLRKLWLENASLLYKTRFYQHVYMFTTNRYGEQNNYFGS